MSENLKSRGTVWVVTIDGIAEPVVAVASDKATALHWAGVKATEYLTLGGCQDEDGTPWSPATVAEYFGYHATELEIDGEANYHYY